MKSFLLACFVFLATGIYAQSSYSTTSNRVLLNGTLNLDTFLVESITNDVIVNGITNQVEITFHNENARTVSNAASSYGEDRGNIELKFHNEYLWLAERLKSDQVMVTLADEIFVSYQNEEVKVPVNIVITRIRGGQGFINRLELSA